uniref:Short-chain dehydrogenase n=1 Tax=Candidatus Kentrum sp. DK TaxID=2126562 RepID=A0A450SJQ4_9GAMM|nr:MAG: Short-chain dehydrogenase [Candidatus Kentron sp. DK]
MNTKQLKGKTVWITGASSGIGEALALRMAAIGARVILSARREGELERVAARCRDAGARAEDIRILPLDLGDGPSLPAKAREAWGLFGGIHILVNNGGVSQRATALETGREVDRTLMEVNYFGTVALTKAILPAMIGQGDGRIVVTSSVLGKYGIRTRSGYAAAKHALHGFFDSLRCEMAAAGSPIGITLICPGQIQTNISMAALRGDGTPHGTATAMPIAAMPVEKFADKMLKAILQGREEVVIGGIEARAVWLKRLFPGVLNRILPKIPMI